MNPDPQTPVPTPPMVTRHYFCRACGEPCDVKPMTALDALAAIDDGTHPIWSVCHRALVRIVSGKD